jgi:hypothetical protein
MERGGSLKVKRGFMGSSYDTLLVHCGGGGGITVYLE